MTTPPEDMPPWGSPQPEPPVSPVMQPERRPEFACPVCGGSTFRQEEGRMNTRWGAGSHIFTLQVCTRCQHVLVFYQGGGWPM